LFTAVDIVAGLQWTDEEIPRILLQLAMAMSDEVDAIARFDAQLAYTTGESR
jgi:hypothetical protein